MSVTRRRATLIIACVLTSSALTGCGKKTPTPTVAATKPTTAAPALPSYWIATDIADNWPGQHWSKIDLFTFIKGAPPKDLDTGTRYVTFFGRTCEHCEEMFSTDLAMDPGLAAQVTAIEVPVESDKLRGDDPWTLPDTDCTFGELQLGPNWIMTTPVTVRLENGVVKCAQEGGHKECMGLE